MSLESEDKTTMLLRQGAQVATVVTLLALIYCFSRTLECSWETLAMNFFGWSRSQANEAFLWAGLIGLCGLLISLTAKIESSGRSFFDTKVPQVRQARKCALYIIFISGLLLVTSKAKLIASIGLSALVLVLSLVIGFRFKQFRDKPGILGGVVVVNFLVLLFLILRESGLVR